MFIIGITGGIACGKSTVSKIISQYGIDVIDADLISHQVTAAGGSAIPEIIDTFGPQFISDDKSMDRKKMGDLVFKHAKELDKLSMIIHRHVIQEIKLAINKFAKLKTKVLVLDVPIPVKEGFLDVSDQIWLVWSNHETRIERLLQRGMEREEAERRIQIQMTEEEYAQIADHIIYNNDSLEDLETRVLNLLEKELLNRGIPFEKTRKDCD